MTLLTYTRLCEELEYLKTKTRLKDERFPSVMGESRCDLEAIDTSSMFNVIRKDASLANTRSVFAFTCEQNTVRRWWKSGTKL